MHNPAGQSDWETLADTSTEWPAHFGAIIGYDTPEPVCPDCLPAYLNRGGTDTDAETLLDSLAAQKGVDRLDLRTYDTKELPKPIFEGEEIQGEYCNGVCEQPIG
jgi:hypothetical protein